MALPALLLRRVKTTLPVILQHQGSSPNLNAILNEPITPPQETLATEPADWRCAEVHPQPASQGICTYDESPKLNTPTGLSKLLGKTVIVALTILGLHRVEATPSRFEP